MGLTDPAFLIVLIVLLVVAIAALVVLWPRLAGTRWWAVPSRIGSILGINLLVVVVAAVSLNDTFLFFSSWSDLTASGDSSAVAGTSGGSVTGAVTATVAPAGSVPTVEKGVPVPGSSTDRSKLFDVTGTDSGVTSKVLVLLPAGYADPANAHRTYPVIEAFPGFPGTALGLAKVFDISATMDRLASEKQLAESLVVIAEPWSPPRRDTECVDGPGGTGVGDLYETWSAVDVPAWVGLTFRAAKERASWATFGISAGAWCAAMVAMRHPAQFSAAIEFAGYFRPDFANWMPYPAGDPLLERYDLVKLAGTSPPPVAMFVMGFTDDELSYPSTQAFIAAARPPLSVTTRIGSLGGHLVRRWVGTFAPALDWLGHGVPGFAPAP